ncbi:MAG TPA: hypothetical protein DD435_11370 [Cyanobacteria bacterium UBA8530]|nr:hypothetical protein [Cyanobacteria bacterium UBA8530]
MSNVNSGNTGNTGRLNGTGRLGSLKATSLPPETQKGQAGAASAPEKATDSLGLQKANTPSPADSALTDRSLNAMGSLSSGVQKFVSANKIAEGMPDVAKEKQVIENLKGEITKLVPGGVKFEEVGGEWKVSDLTNLYNSINAVPLGDRSALAGTSFQRAGTVTKSDTGYSDALKNAMGEDIAGGAVGGMAGATSTAGTTKKSLWERISASFKKYEEKFFSFFTGKTLTPEATGGSAVPTANRAITLTDSGSFVSGDIYAHEIGHLVQQSNGRWDPEKIKEFGKLSKWTESYGDGKEYAADGVDNRTGGQMSFDNSVTKAKNTGNFVSNYAKTDPAEDFAESYRAYATDPDSLMKSAPDKFLFINSTSRKYSAEEVGEMAKKAGVDLNKVATDLVVNSGLKQESLSNILKVHGLTADKTAVLNDSQTKKPLDALGIATARITSETLKGNQDFIDGLGRDPQAAIGPVTWSKLSKEERALLSDKTFVQKMVDDVKAGTASQNSLGNEVQIELARQGVKDLMTNMVTDANFRQALQVDPQKALQDAGIWDKLPAEMRDPIVDPKNKQAVNAMLDKISTSGLTASMQQNLTSYVSKLTPESFQVFAQQLGDKNFPDKAAQNLDSILKTGVDLDEKAGGPPCM